MINFVTALSKFTAEPLPCGSWFHSHVDDVMTQFIINKRTDTKKQRHQFVKYKTDNVGHTTFVQSLLTYYIFSDSLSGILLLLLLFMHYF